MTVEMPQAMVHSFTPDEAPADISVIEPVIEQLLAMPLETEDDLFQFLDAWNETSCWIGDHISRSRVAANAHTDDEEAQQHLMKLFATVVPPVTKWSDELSRKFLDAPNVDELEEGAYRPFLREVRVGVELFREENVHLGKEVDEFANTYQQISGRWAIDFEGEPRTMSQMQRFLSSADRSVRESAWRATRAEIATTSDELEDLFEEMFELRQQIAANAGFDNYRDYAFVEKLRDYGPEECHAFADLIELEVLPLVDEIAEYTTDRLGLDSFRPWDAHAEPDGGEALHPFEEVTELEDGVSRMMHRLDPSLGERFEEIRSYMDLESRQNKAQGGYMTWLSWARRPFIYANASGNHNDIVTLVHESGHAFHGLLAANACPMTSASTPMEFNEVASMSQELLHYRFLDEFYDETDRERAIKQHLRRIPNLLASVARGDQFQHWLYEHGGHTRTERRAKWIEMMGTYNRSVDWSGIDPEIRADSYHPVLHFFIVPMYYIEYGFAQLGALQVAINAERDLEGAMKSYKEALSLGPTRDVRGLFAAAGAEFVPTRERLHDLMNWIRRQLFD